LASSGTPPSCHLTIFFPVAAEHRGRAAAGSSAASSALASASACAVASAARSAASASASSAALAWWHGCAGMAMGSWSVDEDEEVEEKEEVEKDEEVDGNLVVLVVVAAAECISSGFSLFSWGLSSLLPRPSQQGPFGALAFASPRSPGEARGASREVEMKEEPLHRKGQPINADADGGSNADSELPPAQLRGSPRRPRRSRAAAAAREAALPAPLIDGFRREQQRVGRCFPRKSQKENKREGEAGGRLRSDVRKDFRWSKKSETKTRPSPIACSTKTAPSTHHTRN